MAKSNYSPIPTTSELREYEVIGNKPSPQAHMTVQQVRQILQDKINIRPDANQLDKAGVAHLVEREVNKLNKNEVYATNSGVVETDEIKVYIFKHDGKWWAREH